MLGYTMMPCIGLHAVALCWSSTYLTDGFIPAAQIPKLTGDVSKLLPNGDPLELVIALLKAGLWEDTEGGYKIHDYLDYNPSREEVLAERAEKHAAKVRAGKAGAAQRWQQDSRPDSRTIIEDKQKDGPVPVPVPVPVTTKNKKELLSGSDKPDVAKEILTYLNEKTGNTYRPVKENLSLITARMKGGATIEQIKAVIDAKVAEWKNDPERKKYLRPSTLFGATKFEQYLGQVNNGQPPIGSRPADRMAWEGLKPGKVKL